MNENDFYPDNTNTYKRLLKISQNLQPKIKHNLKIGIIVPPSIFVVPTGWEFVHTAPFEGPSVIASLLKGIGLDVVILDERSNFNPYALKGGSLKGLDFIGVATYSDSFPYIKKTIEIAKEEEPKRPVILGGPLVSSVPELIMKNTLADYAVIGEGELTLIELMDFFLKEKQALPIYKIKGLSWKNEQGKVIINSRRAQMYNLDAVPLQDLSLWPTVQKEGTAPEIYMTFSRGCSGNCSFCFRAMPLLRYKSPQRVHRELKQLKKYKYRFAWWSDLTFVESKQRVHKFMDEAFSGIDFRWSCFTRVDGLDLSVLSHMRDKGCDIVMYGFESITKEILDYFKKGVTEHQIIEAIELTRRAGLKVGGLFIIGGPGETKESLKRVMGFCKRFKEVTRVKYLSALPGTALYYDALKKGIIKDELEHLYFLAREHSVKEDEFLQFTDIPEETLREAYDKINQQIELRPYEYWNPSNRYLEEGQKFKGRPNVILAT